MQYRQYGRHFNRFVTRDYEAADEKDAQIAFPAHDDQILVARMPLGAMSVVPGGGEI